MVSDSLSDESYRGDGGTTRSRTPRFHTTIFEQQFPYYLSIGMTEEQYWNGDCTLVKAYRKADELKLERRNMEMWLQGRYVYDAIAAISPILHAFAKKGTKAKPYTESPYPISKQRQEKAKETKAKNAAEKGKGYMVAFMAKFNKRFEKKKE